MKQSIAVAKGDGIGTEIMDVVINIFEKVGVPLNYTYVEMGKDVFLAGHKLGMTKEAKNTIEQLGILFKGPMETPKGGGNRSINVTARKMWGTFANCRVFKTLPGVETIYSKASIPINLTIIRENLEDTYGGVEHLISSNLAISRKFTSSQGCYQIHKYAFDYAKKNGISSIVCGHKANIMKLTDGLFLKIFYEVAASYPEIKTSDIIVDDLCMKLSTSPEKYELIVLPNLQGDIVSDLCAGLIGGLGFAPSANIGNNINIFEAVHGTAPDITGKGIANPTALLMSGLMMLNYLGFNKQAKKIELAIIQTLKNGVHTIDLAKGKPHVSTKEYGNAIVEQALKIGDDHPEVKGIINSPSNEIAKRKPLEMPVILKSRVTQDECVGVDLFIESGQQAKDLATIINEKLTNKYKDFRLESISNRGIGVYPEGSLYTECIDNYTIRLLSSIATNEQDILKLCLEMCTVFKISSIEILRNYEGKAGFSII